MSHNRLVEEEIHVKVDAYTIANFYAYIDVDAFVRLHHVIGLHPFQIQPKISNFTFLYSNIDYFFCAKHFTFAIKIFSDVVDAVAMLYIWNYDQRKLNANRWLSEFDNYKPTKITTKPFIFLHSFRK